MNKAVLDKDNIAISTGSIIVFNYDAITLEYLNSTNEHLIVGIGLPANSCIDAPPDIKEGYVACRSPDLTSWLIVPDYRGKTAYNKQTRLLQEITEIGELPEILTFKKPGTDYDKWDGKEWVIDKDILKASQIEEVKQQQVILLRQANETLSLLQDAVDLEMATDGEKAALLEWKKYRVMLSRVDVNQAPSIEWPEVPK
ncbi:Caudovirales tail fiber assembly protein [Photorhabdus australis subsp. thailandensis]|uniref:Caudovirales tail fiber assembly protein n=1 Tax=Photorhabdus australis subsp. thailandensis TaxID=2805096 RepID=A0A1C0U410_9GAMM|nr:tail fiber assembly protein [Photorhabdus australis]OCQ52670.1 Caudovirales tail fiber assembly protein [Photorhabdus australis subsp. thailandensis]